MSDKFNMINYLNNAIESECNLNIAVFLIDGDKLTIHIYSLDHPSASYTYKEENHIVYGDIIREYNHKQYYRLNDINREEYDMDVSMINNIVIVEHYHYSDQEGEDETHTIDIYTNSKDKYNEINKLLKKLQSNIDYKVLENNNYKF